MDFNIGSVLKLVSEANGIQVTIEPTAPSDTEMEITEGPDSIKENYLTKYGFKIEKEKVQSGATCMLDGLGADEIFCGYRRYRSSFLRGGIVSMMNEMKFGKRKPLTTLDVGRLWLRNLSRDDRNITANGVEIRFPFLDQRIIREVFSNSRSRFKQLSDFTMPRGAGDKVSSSNFGRMLTPS
jgi:asparagine synthetase B (glutamine-hydrolysing)